MKNIFQNSSKGFFLVFTLLLVAVIAVSSVVMLTTTQTNKVSAESSVVGDKLSQIVSQNIYTVAKTLDSSTQGGLMHHLHQNKANIYFVWKGQTKNETLAKICSFGTDSDVDKCTSSRNSADLTQDLKSYIFFDNKIKLSNPLSNASDENNITPPLNYTFPIANQDITQIKYSTDGASRAIYTLKISQRVCKNADNINSQQVCQDQSREFVFTRDCPNSINGRKMRALKEDEIKTLGISELRDTLYPNLYCTCGDPAYLHTSKTGMCCGSTCDLDTSGDQCVGHTGSKGWPSPSSGSLGTYLVNNDTCADCSIGCSYCSSATKCLYCYRISETSGYTMLNYGSPESSCVPCGYGALVNGTPSTGFYNDNIRPIPQCSACDSKCLYCYGPRDDQCIACKASNIRGGSNNSTCSPCPEGTFSFNDFRSNTCAVNTSTNCVKKSKISNTCELCDASEVLAMNRYFLFEGRCYKCPQMGYGYNCQCYDGLNVWKDWACTGSNGYNRSCGPGVPNDKDFIGIHDPNDLEFWKKNC